MRKFDTPGNNMKEDLFEEENDDRESSESEDPEVFADDEDLVPSNGETEGWDDDDDDENEDWVSLDDELEDELSHYMDTDDTEEELNFDNDLEEVEEGAEAPSWDEEIETPLHDTKNTSKILFLIGVISFTVALIGIGLFVFQKPEPITDIPEYKVEEEKKVLFVTKKVPGIRVKDTVPAEKPEKNAEPAKPLVKENAVTVINGEPLTIAHEGVLYSFAPKTEAADSTDKLTFSIANQPDWTSFNTTTGTLTGTPQKDDVGNHEKIDIRVSDGNATASFPPFDITVMGAGPRKAQKKNIEARPKEVKAELYKLPDLKDLIELSEINDAAIEYHKNVRHVPKAYTLKLEVDCVEASIQVAYRNTGFDSRMFILPKDIQGKFCYIIFWGLYATKDEALKALSSVPAYFGDREIKPKLTIIKQYL